MISIKNEYSKEEIIKQLRDYYSKNSDMDSRSFDRDKKTCSRSTIRIMFGSWGNALEEAGITAKDKRVCSAETVVARFGSWRKALEETGIKDKKSYIEYNKEKLLLILKEKAKKGELKTKRDLDKIEGIPGSKYISKLWSWKELSKKLKLKRVVGTYTKEELIEKYKKACKNNEKVTLSIMLKETGIGGCTISNHFGSWTNFLRLMNEDEEKIFKMTKVVHTDSELVDLYRNFSIEIGEEIYGATEKDLKVHKFKYSSNVLANRFKNLNNLREIAGFKIKMNYPSKYTKEELSELLYIKYKKYGRKLTQKEIRANTKLPGTTVILNYFQTTKISEVWEEVLENKE